MDRRVDRGIGFLLAVALIAGCTASRPGGRSGGSPDGPSGAPAGGAAGSAQNIACGSEQGQRQSCAPPFKLSRAELVDQQSGTRCVLGDNWGFTRDELWVSDGCRGLFRVLPARY